MGEWLVIVLVPLAVLPILLLFRFCGCAQIAGLEEPDPPERVGTVEGPPLTPGTGTPPSATPPSPDNKSPNYRAYILGEQPNPGQVRNPQVVPNGADVIAYWRLIDAAGSSVAKDEKNFRNGEYRSGHQIPTTPPTGSETPSEARNPAHFITGENSLIDSDPSQRCRYFNGGYVFVNYYPGLYSDQFTIEAWIKTDALASGFEHTLFDAGGRYSTPAGAPVADRGFRLFADRDGHWQMDLGAAKNLLPMPPVVPTGTRTHVAMVVAKADPAGIKKSVSLYVDGKPAGTANVSSYLPPHDAPLFIGLSNDANLPTASLNLRYPLLCRAQEVVLHRKALSQAEIENHVDINRS